MAHGDPLRCCNGRLNSVGKLNKRCAGRKALEGVRQQLLAARRSLVQQRQARYDGGEWLRDGSVERFCQIVSVARYHAHAGKTLRHALGEIRIEFDRRKARGRNAARENGLQ